ncbi:Putative Flp pilus-assembly TadE/G-like [Nocardioides alpinus]|uniref:Putative Flp pilus-assembly TadE/G-like n=1 Tax=Nocardioides alpinus TaxID=748909 RepID=A0A1I0YRK1_9ACTN|nr:hypothetical protein CXG46_04370 [Nocardioides alpinus]SFB15831.1 Putative Flp pilus-assembly TadE/G-like [Nocardioides alpinus]
MIARRSRDRDEKGAIAVMTVILSVVIFGAAAIAIDISMLAMERQKLHDAVDAAAHAGAYTMPGDGATAMKAARDMALANDPDLTYDFTEQNPQIRLWCLVASTGSTTSVRADQIPSTCNPGPAPYTTSNYPDLRCNTKICKIPCAPSLSTTCNTVEVEAEKDVDFGFANVFGRSEGSTGSVASAACKGSCGQEAPNPLDVVFMADRTTSMSEGDRTLMKTAILDSLKNMTPSLHYVAFGALHKSRTGTSCATDPTLYDSSRTEEWNVTQGSWVPLGFSNNYKSSSATPTLNTSSNLYRGINCLPNSGVPGYSRGSYGTHLASGMKGAARYLLGLAPNNLSSLPARPGEVEKILIFETDGMPDEILASGSTALTTTSDVGAGLNGTGTNAQKGCNNFRDVAANAKAADITVITVGFGAANTARCKKTEGETGSTSRVRDILAAAASPDPVTGAASSASACNNPAARTAENIDGDYFFCAAQGSELSSIFKTAISQVSTGVRLVKLPK